MPGPSQTVGWRIEGRHVLAAVVGFFAVIFAVNGVFLYWALATNTGIVAAEPYVKGLRYNQRIAADERQKRLEWRVVVDELAVGTPLRIWFTNMSGDPISRLRIVATLGRPSTDRHDTNLAFSPVNDGGYEARVGGIERGSWLLSLEASRRTQLGETQTFRLRRRLWLKP